MLKKNILLWVIMVSATQIWAKESDIKPKSIDNSNAKKNITVSGKGWKQIPSTSLASVAPKNGFGETDYSFWFYSKAVTTAWSGGTFDSKRNWLLIWGGGHGDYFGNEVYALDLKKLAMKRLTDPALPIAKLDNCPQELNPNNGTQPNSRHTYDGLVYMPNVDRMFAFGGSLACGTGTPGNDTWWFDPDRKTWERKIPTGDVPKDVLSTMTAWDPNKEVVYLHNRWGGLYIYDPTIGSEGRYTRVSSSTIWTGWGWNMEYIPEINVLISLSGAGQKPEKRKGKMYWWDIQNKNYNAQELITTGAEALFKNYDAPGLAYDPVLKKLIAWNGSNKVYALDWESKTWIEIIPKGTPNEPLKNGTFGRFIYSSDLDAFVVYNNTKDNAYLLKLR